MEKKKIIQFSAILIGMLVILSVFVLYYTEKSQRTEIINPLIEKEYSYTDESATPFEEIDVNGFYNHLLKVFYKGRWGLINALGEFVLPPVVYSPININAEGDFIIISHGEEVIGSEPRYYHYYFDKDLNLKFSHNYGHGVFPFSKWAGGFNENNSFGYVNEKGKIITKFSLEEEIEKGVLIPKEKIIRLMIPGVYGFGNLKLIYLKGLGLIDKNGNEVIKPIYDDFIIIGQNQEITAASLYKDSMQKMVTDKGEILLETDKDDRVNLIWNLLIVKKSDKCDIYSIKNKKVEKLKTCKMSKNSEILFPAEYNPFKNSENISELVVIKGFPGIYFIDKNGNEVLGGDTFSNAFPFSDGVSLVNDYNEGLGIVDLKGKFTKFKEKDIIIDGYSGGNLFFNGLLVTHRLDRKNNTEETCIINKSGKYVVKCGNPPEIIDEEEPIEIKMMYSFKNKRYLIDANGKTKKSLVLDPHPYLTENRFLEEGVFPVFKNGKYGLVNTKGEPIKLKMPMHVQGKEEFLKNLIYKVPVQ